MSNYIICDNYYLNNFVTKYVQVVNPPLPHRVLKILRGRCVGLVGCNIFNLIANSTVSEFIEAF